MPLYCSEVGKRMLSKHRWTTDLASPWDGYRGDALEFTLCLPGHWILNPRVAVAQSRVRVCRGLLKIWSSTRVETLVELRFTLRVVCVYPYQCCSGLSVVSMYNTELRIMEWEVCTVVH